MMLVDIRTLTKIQVCFPSAPVRINRRLTNPSLILMAMKVCCIAVVIIEGSCPKNLITQSFAYLLDLRRTPAPVQKKNLMPHSSRHTMVERMNS